MMMESLLNFSFFEMDGKMMNLSLSPKQGALRVDAAMLWNEDIDSKYYLLNDSFGSDLMIGDTKNYRLRPAPVIDAFTGDNKLNISKALRTDAECLEVRRIGPYGTRSISVPDNWREKEAYDLEGIMHYARNKPTPVYVEFKFIRVGVFGFYIDCD